MAEIVVILEGKEVRRVRLERKTLTIGRESSNDIALDDPRVSRLHARITFGQKGYVFEDMESARGSLFQGKEVKTRILQGGDIIDIGKTRLCVVAEDGAAPDFGKAAAPGAWSLETWPNIDSILRRANEGGESSKLLKALFEISLSLDTAEEFSDVLARILDKALRIMEGERGFIMLRDPETGELKVHTARDISGPLSGMSAEDVSGSLMRKVVETGEPILIENAVADPAWRTRSMVANKIHSALCVPLKSGKDVTGVIYVDHRTRVAAFTDTDLAFFTTFAIQAQAAIDSSRAYWKLVDGLFGASGDFVAVCGSDGRITRANSGALELLGPGAGKLEARPIEELFVREDRPEVSALLREIAAKGRAPGKDLRFAAADGKVLHLNLSGFALRDRASKVNGICLIGRDRTGETRLIEDLKSTSARLFQLNTMKSEFVGMIAHELKGPLSVVIGYCQLLRDSWHRADRAKQLEQIESMMASGQRAQELIGELLELNRLETGKTDLELAPVDVKELLAEVVSGLALPARTKGVVVEVRLPEKLPLLPLDKKLVRRAFENLASNGIKYNKENGRLNITAAAMVGRLEISFEDEGIGIPEADREHVFKQFFRGGNVQGAHEGTGLGLSIVKAIVERHGGSMSLRSALGKGTTFYVSIPLK